MMSLTNISNSRLSSKLLLPSASAVMATLLYALLRARRPITKTKIHKGIDSTPSGPLKDRFYTIYPADIHGEGTGAYVSLPLGRVRYWVVGPEDGKKIVFIHGLTTPSIIFADVARHLAADGYRVLLFDLYGRGYSDAPETTYTTEIFTTQTALLIQSIGWQNATIAGLSMGGGIAAAFAVSFPHLVDGKLIFMGSIGALNPVNYSWKQRFAISRLGTAWWCSTLRKVYNRRSLNTTGRGFKPIISTTGYVTHISEAVALQGILLPGYNSSVLSSLINGPVANQVDSFLKIGAQSEIKVLLIWGTKDSIVPPHNAEILKKLMPQARLSWFEGAGHLVPATHSDGVAGVIGEFMKM